MKHKLMNAKSMSFSSYAGILASIDDFYIMSTNLTMLETTNDVLNFSLYDNMNPNALLAWQRVRLANHAATSGKEWFEIFRKHNSGTYNNQYMIIDYKLFEPYNALKPNTLWIIE